MLSEGIKNIGDQDWMIDSLNSKMIRPLTFWFEVQTDSPKHLSIEIHSDDCIQLIAPGEATQIFNPAESDENFSSWTVNEKQTSTKGSHSQPRTHLTSRQITLSKSMMVGLLNFEAEGFDIVRLFIRRACKATKKFTCVPNGSVLSCYDNLYSLFGSAVMLRVFNQNGSEEIYSDRNAVCNSI